MFGKSAVSDIRRAAQAHEQAATNAAVAAVDVQKTLERLEMVVVFGVAFFVTLTVMDRIWPRG